MSETSPTDSLARRLVIQRLAAPGVLDRDTLQRAPEKLSQAAGAHVLPRLQRRVVPGGSNTDSLPLARIDRSADPGAMTSASVESASPGPGAAALVAHGGTEAIGTRPSATSGVASSFVGELIGRQTPAISRAGEFVARGEAGNAGLIGGLATTARLLARSEQPNAAPRGSGPSIAASAPATQVVQRVADANSAAHTGTVGATHGVSSVSANAGTTSTAMRSLRGDIAPTSTMSRASSAEADAVSARQAISPAAAGTPAMVMRSPSPTPSVHEAIQASTQDELMTTRPSSRAPSNAVHAPSLLLRNADAAPRRPVGSALPLAVASPASLGVASAPLVLRTPDVTAAKSQAPPSAPPISTAPTSVSTRTTAALESATTQSESMYMDRRTIDWIAEEVGRRLARRLVIERERLGVRTWRQQS